MRQTANVEKLNGHLDKIGGIVMMLAALLALACANTGLAPHYDALVGAVRFTVNDMFMAVFFLAVGLEIRHEIFHGSLVGKGKAVAPLLAALMGMAVPALLYLGLNADDAQRMRGWAIPAVTDIAFALGILAMLGSLVPSWMRPLLLSIAVIDDLGAILVIAFFYTGGVDIMYLAGAAVVAAVLFYLGRINVQPLLAYLVAGILLWWLMLQAGIHPTLAGVITGIAMPAQTGVNVQKRLVPVLAFFILPVFAFVNAGIDLGSVDNPFNTVTLGIMLGLLIGKPFGIFAGMGLAALLGYPGWPVESSCRERLALGLLCGIGFTVALFVAELAFGADQAARLGILCGSALAGIMGMEILRRAQK